MFARRSVNRGVAVPAVALAMLLAACGSGDRVDELPADEGATSVPASTEAVATASDGGYTKDDVGTGTLTYDGVEYPNLDGDCSVSRHSGREDVGDIASGGLIVRVGVDNVKSAPETEVNFIAISDSLFSMVQHTRGQPVKRLRGTMASMQYGSALTPIGNSQSIALVEFAGQTADGIPVIAKVVCEIQNKF